MYVQSTYTYTLLRPIATMGEPSIGGGYSYGYNRSYPLKKVSSTGSMKDERGSVVGLERRRHKRNATDVTFDPFLREKRNPNQYGSNHLVDPLKAEHAISSSKWVERLHAAASAAGECPVETIDGTELLATTQDVPEQTQKPTVSLPALAKPQLKRTQTDPSSVIQRPSLAEDALMNRALIIREDLRQCEMQELAFEAERAAEEGLERFVGSTSKFIGDVNGDTQVQRPYDDDFVLEYATTAGRCYSPQALRKVFTRNEHYPTPPYFNRKKIRVTSLREFREVVPPFTNMHANIRTHLKQQGVNPMVLPNGESYPLLIERVTHNDDDIQSYVSQSGSIVSLAVTSFKNIVDYSRKSFNEQIKYPSTQKEYITATPELNEESSSSNKVESYFGSFEFESSGVDVNDQRNLRKQSLRCETPSAPIVDPFIDDNSDDSSIELYGRRSMTGRASPSSVNGVLSGLSDEKTSAEDKSHVPLIISPSAMTIDATKSMVSFFSNIQHRFSLSRDDFGSDLAESKEDATFISNYFYTNNQDTDIMNSEGLSNFKLDINPNRGQQNDAFCIEGCAQNELLYGCETMGNTMDMISSWFNERKREYDQSSASPTKPFDPQTPQINFHHGWTKTLHGEKGDGQKRVFMPPRLKVKGFR